MFSRTISPADQEKNSSPEQQQKYSYRKDQFKQAWLSVDHAMTWSEAWLFARENAYFSNKNQFVRCIRELTNEGFLRKETESRCGCTFYVPKNRTGSFCGVWETDLTDEEARFVTEAYRIAKDVGTVRTRTEFAGKALLNYIQELIKLVRNVGPEAGNRAVSLMLPSESTRSAEKSLARLAQESLARLSLLHYSGLVKDKFVQEKSSVAISSASS